MIPDLTGNIYRRLFQQKTTFFWKKLWLFGLRTKVTALMCEWWKLRSKQIKLMWIFAFSKADNIQNDVCAQSPAFPVVYWFLNSTVTDKHGTKKSIGTYAPLRNINKAFKVRVEVAIFTRRKWLWEEHTSVKINFPTEPLAE